MAVRDLDDYPWDAVAPYAARAKAHPEGIVDMIAVDMGVVADDLTTDETKVSICAKDSTGPYSHALTSQLVEKAKAALA